MTQEELDALMNGDVDLDVGFEEEGSAAETLPSSDETPSEISYYNEEDADKYRVSALHSWPPPPPTDDNKMVHQLDDVTKESEEKASEIFDLIEGISNDLGQGEKDIKALQTIIKSNVDLFTTLSEKFPHIEAFKTQLSENKQASKGLNDVLKCFKTAVTPS
jgi:hypothetical protein